MCSLETNEIVQSYIKRVLISPLFLHSNQYEQPRVCPSITFFYMHTYTDTHV